LLACSIIFFSGLAAPVHAQWAVIDVSAIAHLVQEVQVLRQQLLTAQSQLSQVKQTFQSTLGNRGMSQLLAGTQRNYLPGNLAQLTNALLGGGSYTSLTTDVRGAISTNAVLTPAQLSNFSANDQQQIASARQSVGMRQAVAGEALANASARFASIQSLIATISKASDQKAILELQARISAELGMLQNEQTKLQVLAQVSQAQDLANTQREREFAVVGQGRFDTRFQPTP
jgi:type IV secretion system protein VirB5